MKGPDKPVRHIGENQNQPQKPVKGSGWPANWARRDHSVPLSPEERKAAEDHHERVYQEKMKAWNSLLPKKKNDMVVKTDIDKFELLISKLQGIKEDLLKTSPDSKKFKALQEAQDHFKSGPHEDASDLQDAQVQLSDKQDKYNKEKERAVVTQKAANKRIAERKEKNRPLGQIKQKLFGKENLGKNVNVSYDSEPNVAKGGLQVPAPHVNLNNPYNEELEFNKRGQWSLKKDARDPKLAPKDIRVKQLQAQIDAGTYKPDPAKIADKMLAHPEKPLKKEEHGVTAQLKDKKDNKYHYELSGGGKAEVVHTPQGQQDPFGLEAKDVDHHTIKGARNNEEREAVKVAHLKQFPKHKIY